MAVTTAMLIAGAGAGMGAMSKLKEGQAAAAEAKGQAQISEYNAQVAEQNAKAIEAKTTFDQLRALRRGNKITGTLRAKLGASGALMDEGAPARLVAEQEFENALEVALIGVEGRTQAAQAQSEAGLQRYQANIYRKQAKRARSAGRLGAATSLLSGFGQMAGAGMFSGGSGGAAPVFGSSTATPGAGRF